MPSDSTHVAIVSISVSIAVAVPVINCRCCLCRWSSLNLIWPDRELASKRYPCASLRPDPKLVRARTGSDPVTASTITDTVSARTKSDPVPAWTRTESDPVWFNSNVTQNSFRSNLIQLQPEIEQKPSSLIRFQPKPDFIPDWTRLKPRLNQALLKIESRPNQNPARPKASSTFDPDTGTSKTFYLWSLM